MAEPSHGDINLVTRLPKRAHYDEDTIHAILDDNLLGHVGFLDPKKDEYPIVVPMLYGRQGSTLFLHGYVSARILKTLRDGAPVCISVAQVDALVLALAIFHHSANYKSAVVFGHGALVSDEAEKIKALEVISNHVIKGRWDESRQPNPLEMRTTTVIKVEIEKASAKIRTGGPKDDEADLQDPELLQRCWTGLLPFKRVYGTPEPAEISKATVPAYLSEKVGQEF